MTSADKIAPAPDEPCTAGDYSRLAREAIAGITERGRLPIVAGGTGLYLRALLDGLFPAPQRNEPLREKLRELAGQRKPGHLHRILARLDPAAAALIAARSCPSCPVGGRGGSVARVNAAISRLATTSRAAAT